MRIDEPRGEAERQAFIERLPHSLRSIMTPCDGGTLLLGAWAGDCLIGRLAAMPATNAPEVYKLLFLLPTGPRPQGLWESVPDPWHDLLAVETALLAEFEVRVRNLGYRTLIMQPVFLVGTSQASLLLTALRMQAWQDIRHVSTKFHIEGYGLLQEHWFHTALPQEYGFFFWRDLTAGDKEYVASRKGEPGYLDPFRIEHFEPQTSLGLRNVPTGRVAGWFVNEIGDSSTIRFGKLYLYPEARGRSCFYPLIAQSVRHAWQHFKRAVLAVNAENPRMYAALTKMIGRHCQMIVDCYYCEKVLYVSGSGTGS